MLVIAAVATAGIFAATCTPAPVGDGCSFTTTADRVQVVYDSDHARVIEASLHGIDRWNAAIHEGPDFVVTPEATTLRAGEFWENSMVIGQGGGPCAPGGANWRSADFNTHPRHDFLSTASKVWLGSHEFGHALGHDHLVPGEPAIDPAQCPDSVMWWSDEVATICGVTDPGPGDVNATNAIYE